MKSGLCSKYWFTLIFVFVLGCTPAVKNQKGSLNSPSHETRKDVETAVGSVMGAMSGKLVSQAQVRDLEKQLQTDKEAQSALNTIAGSVNGMSPTVKYCPTDGKRFSAKFNICPEHGILLKDVTE